MLFPGFRSVLPYLRMTPDPRLEIRKKELDT
jgi:hypothetical protein